MRKPTLKQRRFVKEYLATGNGTQAALKTYETDDNDIAHSIAHENLRKPTVIELLKSQSKLALLDQIAIRKELQKSKKDYAVRSGVNRDILDRAGFGSPDQSQTINFNFISDDGRSEKVKTIASRILGTQGTG